MQLPDELFERDAGTSMSRRERLILAVLAAIGCSEGAAPAADAARFDAPTDLGGDLPGAPDAPAPDASADGAFTGEDVGLSREDAPASGDVVVSFDAPASGDVVSFDTPAPTDAVSGDVASEAAAPRDVAPPPPARFVRVEPGTFQMGTLPTEPLPEAGADPHPVTLTRAFLLQDTEVTQGQWFARMGARPSYFARCGDDCPVEQVSWFEALVYCNALSREEGLPRCYADADGADYDAADAAGAVTPTWRNGLACGGYRLPTEAEWEYAARAGTTESSYNGPVEERGCMAPTVLDPIAWQCENSAVTYEGCWSNEWIGGAACAGTHPVAGKRANPWGLYDVLGNVWEWVWDWHADYALAPAQDPTGPTTGSRREIRGGGWGAVVRVVRVGRRYPEYPEAHRASVGFRPARTVP